jgi:hypothetical protein
MTGIYIQCEQCDATLGGEQVTERGTPTLSRSECARLREEAAKRGWRSEGDWIADIKDFCPEHASLRSKECSQR